MCCAGPWCNRLGRRCRSHSGGSPSKLRSTPGAGSRRSARLSNRLARSWVDVVRDEREDIIADVIKSGGQRCVGVRIFDVDVAGKRHRLCEEVAVRANSVVGTLHHEYFLAPGLRHRIFADDGGRYRNFGSIKQIGERALA